MSKPDFSNVYYRMNDKGEIKLSILFCLRYAETPLSDSDLKHLMLSATSVDFLDLCGIIDELSPDNYIKKVWRDEEEKYILTDKGTETIDVFDDKIMASVRASIKKTVDEYLNREGPKTQVRCVVVPADFNMYNVDVEITEGKNTLLSMTVFTGNKEKAARYAKGFRKNPMEFYTKVIEALAELADKAVDDDE